MPTTKLRNEPKTPSWAGNIVVPDPECAPEPSGAAMAPTTKLPNEPKVGFMLNNSLLGLAPTSREGHRVWRAVAGDGRVSPTFSPRRIVVPQPDTAVWVRAA